MIWQQSSTFQRLLEYRLYEDLRRGWRVAQPNLEQCGLLVIDYAGLHEMCEASEPWAQHPVLQQATPATRERVVRAFLDFLRKEMAIDAKVLDGEEQKELRRRVEQNLRDPWALDDYDRLLESAIFMLPGARPNSVRERSLDPARSKLGKYLRQRSLWGLPTDLTTHDGENLIRELVSILRGNYLTLVPTEQGQDGIQLQAGALQWKLGDGTPPPSDSVRTKRMVSERLRKAESKANQFFAQLYKETARRLVGVEGGAHTGQIPMQLRQDREARFGRGDLAVLFCSPTMELGVDIRDLNVVHLRNVPPTPVNYAQRSGRAGRGGQPALVMAFCSEGSQHDQYFFRQPGLMVAGAVAPARLELGNKELVEAHLHSVWLGAAGCSLGRDMTNVLDLEQAGSPLQPDMQNRVELSESMLGRALSECKRIVDACGEDLARAPWYREEWIRETLLNAPQAFDMAFARWRELYTGAVRQRDENQAISNRVTGKWQERREADRRIEEAKREIDLLLNRSEESVESDFYPYRYLASEGFLPGYNFPRLPLRALIPTGRDVHVIDRPRFLGLAEFGPRNVIYHEGRKYRMARCVLPRTKTGNPVTVLLPPHIADELRSVPPGPDAHPDYFFWSGKGKRNKAASTWQKTLRRLWPLVKPALVLEDRDGKRIQPQSHMFRNSFAVGLLKKHVSVDHVAMLLADDPDTVKQHYYPWVPELQDLLEKEVKRSWDEDEPIILADADRALQGTAGQA